MTTMQQQPATIPDLDQAWALYAQMFREIDELAAQRHLMTRAEFTAVHDDPRVLKFYVHDDAGELAGMSVLTQDLEAWPLISPRYFARRWPEHYARRAIWYVGFVGVRGRLHGFRELVNGMYAHVAANDGLAVMDFCSHNAIRRRMPTITLKLLSGLNPAAAMETADAQTFVAFRFDSIETDA